MGGRDGCTLLAKVVGIVTSLRKVDSCTRLSACVDVCAFCSGTLFSIEWFSVVFAVWCWRDATRSRPGQASAL